MLINFKTALAILSVSSLFGSDGSGLAAVQAHRLHRENFAPNVLSRYISRISKAAHKKISDAMNNGIRSLHERSETESSFAYLSEPSSRDPLDIAKDYIRNSLGFVPDKDYVIANQYKSEHSGVTHIYLKQMVNDIEVENGDLNINIDKLGRVISIGESFFKGDVNSKPESSKPPIEGGGYQFSMGLSKQLDAAEAVKILAKYLEQPIPDDEHISVETISNNFSEEEGPETVVLGFAFTVTNGIPVKQKYLQVVPSDGSPAYLERVWDIQCEMEDNWYHAHVTISDGNLIGLVDWVSDASYRVYPGNDPEDESRRLIVDPADKEASPLGWHAVDKSKTFTSTMGNNVFAHENLDGKSNNDHLKNFRPDGGKKLKFDFPVDLTKEPKTYLKAAITNLFYWNNFLHDLTYKFGFNEVSGNFQQNNFGKGGKGNDAVIANAQDGAGYNNANFATPPDGQPGKMRMYVWNVGGKPFRDGDMEAGIIIHEYMHGVSTRLTGGPANSGCLPFGEAGGMGEGYGDFFATVIRMRKNNTRTDNFGMGVYSMGGKKEGIRKFVYSTDMKTNPSTYSFVKKFAYIGVHAKGEVWAAILYEVYWNLVDKFGFSENLFDTKSLNPDTGLPAGNVMALQLLIDSMKLQPCRPTFVDARDAILQADEANYDGAAVCEIWKGFAKRGLGAEAQSGGKEDFSLPEECQ